MNRKEMLKKIRAHLRARHKSEEARTTVELAPGIIATELTYFNGRAKEFTGWYVYFDMKLWTKRYIPLHKPIPHELESQGIGAMLGFWYDHKIEKLEVLVKFAQKELVPIWHYPPQPL